MSLRDAKAIAREVVQEHRLDKMKIRIRIWKFRVGRGAIVAGTYGP